MFKRQDNNKIISLKKEIRETYLKDNIPWIIGYSGGKDSTVVLQLVVEVLFDLAQDNLANKKVYVISSDTLVENPLVIAKTLESMKNIEKYSKENKLPLIATMLYPEFDNTFFVNLIGRGYPVPLQSFRWCTDRIKIKPADKFIYEKVNENGEVILLLGTRKEESASRARSMEKHEIENNILALHSTIDNAWTYPVIRDLTVNDVWDYLLKNKSPWGGDNEELYKLYSSSSLDGECPLVIDSETKNTQTCGNSRFGCWTCTVVTKDKSLTGFINNGEKWLKPLLEFRDDLIKNRDIQQKRRLFDKNGNLKLVEVEVKNNEIYIPAKLDRKEITIPLDKVLTYDQAIDFIAKNGENSVNNIIINKRDKYFRVGRSGYTIEYRYGLLKRLFEIEKLLQKKIKNYNIIMKEEIIEIDNIWKKEGIIEYNAIILYNQFHDEKPLHLEHSNINYDLLKSLSIKNNINNETMKQIINNTKLTQNLNNRNSNIKYIEKKLSEHKLLIKGNK